MKPNTTTFLFNESDPELYTHERAYLRELAVKLTKRCNVVEFNDTERHRPPHPNALAATHWGKKPDGDL